MPKKAADLYLELEKNYRLPDLASLKRAWNNFVALDADVIQQRNYLTVIHYYDNDNLDLLKSGTTLRKMDAFDPYFKAEMGIKTIGTATGSGIMDRKEYPFKMDSDHFDLSKIDIPAAKERLAPLKGQPPKEFFYNLNDRQDMRKAFGKAAGKRTPRAVIEVSIEKADFVDAATGKVFDSIFTVEIELKQKYSSRALKPTQAEALIDHIGGLITKGMTGVTVDTRSKAEIGFAHYR